jgi:hypothetical protein
MNLRVFPTKGISMARPYKLSEAGRRVRSERMKRQNADPEFAAKHAAAASETMKRLHADPEIMAKRVTALRAAIKRKAASCRFTNG